LSPTTPYATYVRKIYRLVPHLVIMNETENYDEWIKQLDERRKAAMITSTNMRKRIPASLRSMLLREANVEATERYQLKCYHWLVTHSDFIIKEGKTYAQIPRRLKENK